jgi:hypothetical protein
VGLRFFFKLGGTWTVKEEKINNLTVCFAKAH